MKAVFLEQRPMLFRLLTARLGSPDEAEDTLQDMWLKLDSFVAGPIAQPAAYLFRMAMNLAADRRIGRQRSNARDTAWLDAGVLADELPGIERELVARDRLRRVEAAIEGMPDRMRDALRMFRIDERPQRDIALHLGISVSGVEKMLKRAYRVISDADEDGGADIATQRRHVDEGGVA